MVCNTTYKNENYDSESTSLVGDKFTLLERIKYRNIGSKRLMINKMSPKLNLGKPNFSEIEATVI